MHFLRRISKADDYELKACTIGKYLLEVGTLEWRLLATPPLSMAAAVIWLARLILGNDTWTATLAHYPSYVESPSIPITNPIPNYVPKPIKRPPFKSRHQHRTNTMGPMAMTMPTAPSAPLPPLPPLPILVQPSPEKNVSLSSEDQAATARIWAKNI
ncbi:hypothetical protein PAXRUDRAFT_27271 [Paxillus rubicundulus Ve08.2h10]|uniref:Cyclin-like domain-containing protein n=1 Tax=Paxillus rubicundulus Ve08.2h10 TaxID=930991 RepID=A0A0D0DWZ1_9AGAM|nr:hypothetical protein PAXRUDRAFT_27271 [Paxillus rubicundulus Ve08.2h10]